MSEYRYFRSASGGVVRSLSPKGDAPYVEEVKVVPLDAVVIEGPLPEVEAFGTGGFQVNNRVWSTRPDPADLDEQVKRYVALARYLREHPPVDEAQVKALASIYDEFTNREGAWHPEEIARYLVQRGVRVEGVSES